MPWVEALSDPQEFRSCIRDLVALSTLPAVGNAFDPDQIADNLATALLASLEADFVHVRLRGTRDRPPIEVSRPGAELSIQAASLVNEITQEWLLSLPDESVAVKDLGGLGSIRIATTPLGHSKDAVVVAASRHSGFPTGVQRLLLDIAADHAAIALQRAEAELDARRFVVLVERSSDFIGVASLEGRAQYINAAGLHIMGLTGIEEVSGLRIVDFLSPDERSRALAKIWPTVMQQGRWSGEVVFRHFKTGEAIPFLVDWFRIDDPRTGRPMNIATVSRDLRAQKRAEAELRDLNDTLEQRVAERTRDLERAHEKLVAETSERERADARLQELQLELFHAARLSVAGQMGAALAHEINQPLTATANSINAARRLLAATGSGDVSTLKDVMEEAAEQALRGGQIVRRLRAFVTRGETEKHLENLPTLIKEASGLALIGISSLGVQVEFRFDPNAPDVFADRVQIQQVLVNLMRNAFEAMAQTENRQLVISTTRIDHATVEVMVADSGPGLPDDIVRHLFEPFFSTREDGMGLGLSICRSIVEAHGGALNGEPNPGGGTIFRFTLSALPTREDGDDA